MLEIAADIFVRDHKPYTCYAPLALSETVAELASQPASAIKPVFSTMLCDRIDASVNENLDDRKLEFEIVESDEQIGRFATICADGFSITVDEQPSFVQPASNKHQHWLGRIGETDVVTGTLMLLDDVAWIADVVTIPEFRRRGMATAMLNKLLRCAIDFGGSSGFSVFIINEQQWSRGLANWACRRREVLGFGSWRSS